MLLEVKLTTSSHAVHVVLILTGGAKMQVTGHRLQATGQVTGHRSQAIQKKTIGHWTKLFWTDVLLYKNKISQGALMIFLSFKQY